MKLEVASVQVDNQLNHAVYPVLLSTTNAHLGLQALKCRAAIDTTHSRSSQNVRFSNGIVFMILVAKSRHSTGSVNCFQCISLQLVPLQLEMKELLVSCLLCFLANAIGSFFGSKSGKLGNVWLWSSLQGTYLGGAEKCAATPETFEVVQVSRACGSVRFSKVVKQLE
ncbi:unnamed protein product [Sphagnum jensenii]|uniref:Uncharacterized protein n=1 Tax=Sphagnum jensenii TaxID=128206 RepID=A0ABP1ABW0_9BRYO